MCDQCARRDVRVFEQYEQRPTGLAAIFDCHRREGIFNVGVFFCTEDNVDALRLQPPVETEISHTETIHYAPQGRADGGGMEGWRAEV